MSRSDVVLGAVLASVVALTACDGTSTEPANASPGPALGVQGATNGGREAPSVPGPFGPAMIIEVADELGLTAEQRAAIEAIAEELRELNEPLWADLRGGPPGQGGPPAGGPDLRRDLDDPTMRAIRENTRAAMEDALALLTEEQAREFRELRRERRPSPPGVGSP